MKIDVVIDFYRNRDKWPLVAWGLAQNQEHIHRVIIVNDEPWTDESKRMLHDPVLPMPWVLRDHEHDGVGASKCILQGADEVETEYFAHIDSDIVLAPHSISNNLEYAEPEMYVAGIVHDCIQQDVTLESLPSPPVARRDWRLEQAHPMVYPDFRDLYWIAETASYFNAGGHDPEYKDYGMVDYDFAVKWLNKYGLESYTLGPGHAYHLCWDGEKGNPPSKPTSEANKKRFQPHFDAFIAKWKGQLGVKV